MKKFNFSNLMLILGIIFFYLPMIILIVYSFNASQLVTVWGGFSVKWYKSLVDNEQLLTALWHSLQIAFYTVITSLILGTMCALVLTRVKKFKGKNLFASITTAPLVMPEIITGLSLLLLFVLMNKYFGFPENRGIITIWIAHSTLTTAYVTMILVARLQELDKSIEEAASDLGAKPLKVFFLIVLPMILPSLGAAAMMSFSLSLDDLVLASFVTGPGATTLPLEIYSSVRLGVKPDINAIATIIIFVISILTFIAGYLMKRNVRLTNA